MNRKNRQGRERERAVKPTKQAGEQTSQQRNQPSRSRRREQL